MPRSVPEWVGASPDSMPPPRVRARIFQAHEGRCYRTGRKIAAGEKWALDHIIAIINGGENRESNLAPILDEPHRAKTAADMRLKAKIARVRNKHLGLKPKFTRKLPGSKDGPWKAKIGGQWEKRNR